MVLELAARVFSLSTCPVTAVYSHRRETAEHSAGSFTRPLILSYSDENLDVRRGSLVF